MSTLRKRAWAGSTACRHGLVEFTVGYGRCEGKVMILLLNILHYPGSERQSERMLTTTDSNATPILQDS